YRESFFVALPSIVSYILWPLLPATQWGVSFSRVKVGRLPSRARYDEVTASRRCFPPLARIRTAPSLMPYFALKASDISDGIKLIVFVVCDWLTAVTCTHACGCATPTGSPFSSQWEKRDGPTSSTRQRTASSGSLPQPFMRWSTPLR